MGMENRLMNSHAIPHLPSRAERFDAITVDWTADDRPWTMDAASWSREPMWMVQWPAACGVPGPARLD